MIYKIDTKNSGKKYPDEIILITEEDTWEDVAAVLTKFYSHISIGDLIYALIELKPDVLDELLSWPMVQKKIRAKGNKEL